MDFKYIDIHSHLNLKPLSNDMEAVILRMKEKGVGTITVGTDIDTSKRAIEISEKYPEISWATVGLHPTESQEHTDISAYLELAKNQKVVAIGECGLDYFRLDQNDTNFENIKNVQKENFQKHIEIAKELNKPLMIHARPSKGSMDAYDDALDILEAHNVKCNFHFFVGDMEVTKRIIKNGWSVSFDGPITFSRDYDEVIKFLPIENIMAETDAPFASPNPYRGKIGEPWMVEEVVKKIAEIKEREEEEIREKILENSRKFFSLT